MLFLENVGGFLGEFGWFFGGMLVVFWGSFGGVFCWFRKAFRVKILWRFYGILVEVQCNFVWFFH